MRIIVSPVLIETPKKFHGKLGYFASVPAVMPTQWLCLKPWLNLVQKVASLQDVRTYGEIWVCSFLVPNTCLRTMAACNPGKSATMFTLEMELFTFWLCSRLSSLPTVQSSRNDPCSESNRSHYPLNSWFRRTISTLVDFFVDAPRPTLAPLGSQAFSDLLATIRLRAPMYPGGVGLEDANSASKCLTMSQWCDVLCPTMPVDAKNSSIFHLCGIWDTHISSAKRRAGGCALFGFPPGTQSS